MTSRNRRLLGLLLALLAICGIAAFAFWDVPPVRMIRTYCKDTGEMTHSTKLHWAVGPSAGLFLAGLVFVLTPRTAQEVRP